MRSLAPILAGLMAMTVAPSAAAAATDANGDAAGAKAFVLGLYAAYHGNGPDYLGRQAAQVFSPRLLALIRRDRRLANGEVGALDGDPICNCQDFGISKVRAEVAMAQPGRAGAVVSFLNLGKAEVVRLDLVATRGGWRIDNIHEAGTPDLADYLRKHAGGR